MKALVLWSSRTGNTKAVGEAIYDALPCEKEIFESGRQPKDLSGYDLVYVGFWGYRQGADMPSRNVLSSLHGKKVAIYGTHPDYDLAAWVLGKFPPDSNSSRVSTGLLRLPAPARQ